MTSERRHPRAVALRAAVLGMVLALVAMAATATSSLAQTSAAESPFEITGVDVSEFPTVRLRVAVGSGVAGDALDDDTIVVTENGAPVIAEVTPLAGETVAVLLVIDTSGSMVDAIAQAKAAATALVSALPAGAEVGVVAFSSAASTVSGFTQDRAVTSAAIDALRADGGTALYDAVAAGAEQLAGRDAERKAMVVLSDGLDTDSQRTLDAAVAAVADGAVGDLFAVALETEEFDVAALTRLADSGGGRVVAADDPAALATVYADLGARIANQFLVEFVSSTPERTGEFTIGLDGVEGEARVSVALPDRPSAPTTEAPPFSAPPVLTVEPETTPLEQSWVLYTAAGVVALAITAMFVLAGPALGARRPVGRRSLSSDASDVEMASVPERVVGAARSAATRLSARVLARSDTTGVVDAALDRAGLIMRSSEFVATVVALTLGVGFVSFLLTGPVGLVVGALVPFGSIGFLRFRRARRNRRFADQLSDTLLLISGSLRSGFGVGQAIATVAEEMDPPISVEFQRAILEARLGRDLEDALQRVAARVDNEDFEWVVDAMRINRQVGGELADILEKVSDTIRARNRLKRQVSALTAEGRMSAYVLGALPIGMGGVLFVSNPDYMQPMFDRPIGVALLGASGLLLLGGVLWLRRLISIEY